LCLQALAPTPPSRARARGTSPSRGRTSEGIMRKRVAVLISGRGSNLKALLDARQDAYEIVLVISNIPDAGGLEIARAARVAALTIDHKPFGKDREAFEREVDAALRAHNVKLVAL